MEWLLVLAALIAIVMLAPRFGVDTRESDSAIG
jgi:hypothetical protein